MQHDWRPSKLGHGDVMCSRCFVTNLEAAALGISDTCDVPPKAANENAVKMTQDQIDNEMLSDEVDDGEDDLSAECGRWNNGYLTGQCRLAGSEWCDWDCPVGC